jgi:predicted secreted protein
LSLIPVTHGHTVELTLSEAQNGAQLAVYMADTLVVRLREIPDAGYRWVLASVDAGCLEMTEHRYESARAEFGSAGMSIWRFQPKRPGRTRLVLTKLSKWTAVDVDAERFAVDLELR